MKNNQRKEKAAMIIPKMKGFIDNLTDILDYDTVYLNLLKMMKDE